jgi:hypothetical protein
VREAVVAPLFHAQRELFVEMVVIQLVMHAVEPTRAHLLRRRVAAVAVAQMVQSTAEGIVAIKVDWDPCAVVELVATRGSYAV